MSAPITFITSHALDGRTVDASDDEHQRFAEFVASHQPRLLDFQAYVNEDKSELKLFFVFPDAEAGERDLARPEPADRPFRDSGWAGLLAGVAIVVIFFAAVYLGSIGVAAPA